MICLIGMTNAGQPPTGDDVRLLLEFVRGRDCSCPVCRYNLRDLTHPVCPECGCELRLQVGTVIPRVGLLLWAMGPLMIGAGLGAIFGIVALAAGFPSGWGFYVLLSLGILDLVACFAVYRGRHHFLRSSRRIQAAIILLDWAFHVLVVSVSIVFGAW